jgi:hypothetical protein
MAVFLPEKRSQLLRGGILTVQVHGDVFQFGNPEAFAELGDGTKLDYAFDPDEPILGAAIYAEGGFLCWAAFIPEAPAFSERDRSQEIGPQYIKRYKAAHRTAFRALDLKSLRPVAIAEHRDGAGRVARVEIGSVGRDPVEPSNGVPASRLQAGGVAISDDLASRLQRRRDLVSMADDALKNLTD